MSIDHATLALTGLALLVAVLAALRSRRYARLSADAMRDAEHHAARAQAAADRATAASGLARGYVESKATRDHLLDD